MRLLTMLATAVLLATCVHDTDDFTLFVAETGASLTYYIGSEGDDFRKSHDDPWDTINEKSGGDSVRTGKEKNNGNGGYDDPWDSIQDSFSKDTNHTGTGTKNDEPADPWDTIQDKFGTETTHTGKTVGDEEDPWNRINSLFLSESVHTGKTNDRFFLGFEKSAAVFMSFDYGVSATDRARVVEARGNVLKMEFADGVVQYVIDAPATWTEGTQLVTGFLDATSKKNRPFLGVRFWRTVKGGQLEPALSFLAPPPLASPLPSPLPSPVTAPASAPKESVHKVVPDTINGELVWPDPWDQISDIPLRSY